MKYLCILCVQIWRPIIQAQDRVANTYLVIKTIDATIKVLTLGCKRIRTVYNDNLRRENVSREYYYTFSRTETEVQDKSRWAVGWLGERGTRLAHSVWVYNLLLAQLWRTPCYYRQHTHSDISFAEIAYLHVHGVHVTYHKVIHVYRHRRANAFWLPAAVPSFGLMLKHMWQYILTHTLVNKSMINDSIDRWFIDRFILWNSYRRSPDILVLVTFCPNNLSA